MAKVTEMVRFTFTPISWAAPLSSLTARMALPIRVLPVNHVKASMIRMQASTVTMATSEIISWPSNRRTGPKLMMDVKLLGLEPQISSARFCRR